jgi:hypothetical protein
MELITHNPKICLMNWSLVKTKLKKCKETKMKIVLACPESKKRQENL